MKTNLGLADKENNPRTKQKVIGTLEYNTRAPLRSLELPIDYIYFVQDGASWHEK